MQCATSMRGFPLGRTATVTLLTWKLSEKPALFKALSKQQNTVQTASGSFPRGLQLSSVIPSKNFSSLLLRTQTGLRDPGGLPPIVGSSVACIRFRAYCLEVGCMGHLFIVAPWTMPAEIHFCTSNSIY